MVVEDIPCTTVIHIIDVKHPIASLPVSQQPLPKLLSNCLVHFLTSFTPRHHQFLSIDSLNTLIFDVNLQITVPERLAPFLNRSQITAPSLR